VLKVIATKARVGRNSAQIPKDKRFKLWGETVKTITALDNLISVTRNGVTKTQYNYEHAGHEIPKLVKYLRIFGEAGIVKNMKDRKVSNRGITMMLVGYANEHTGIATECIILSHHEFVRHVT
jgi:hypothetical protein